MPAFDSGVPGLRPFTSLGFATSVCEGALDERLPFPFLLYFKNPSLTEQAQSNAAQFLVSPVGQAATVVP